MSDDIFGLVGRTGTCSIMLSNERQQRAVEVERTERFATRTYRQVIQPVRALALQILVALGCMMIM